MTGVPHESRIGMSIATEIRLTPEDLLSLPEGQRYELVDGQLVEHHMSHAAVWIATRIAYLLQQYLDNHPIGDVYGEGASYRCFPADPQMVRRADVSFLRTGRLSQEQFDRGHCPVAPDLAVEVISPNDLAYDVSRKIEDYASAGVPLVWLVNPDTRTVTVYRQGGAGIDLLHADDELTGGDVLPGFACRVGAVFPPATVPGA